jgi:hypothetical protein
MTSSIARDIMTSGALAVLFVVLYQISGLISGNQAIGGIVSLFFLPAFVRLLGFLLVGYWIIPTLFLTSMYLTVTGTYDLGPGYGAEVIMGAFTAVGGPLGAFLASRIGKLDPTLENLTPLRLLLLSLGCSAGNGIFHEMALRLAGFPATPEFDAAYVLVGDLVGTWAIIYLIKTALTLYGRSISR